MTKSALFFSAAIVGVAACSALPGTGSSSEEQQQVRVTQLWLQTCAACHGEDGKGGGAGTRTFHTKQGFMQENDRYYFDTITNGTPGGMSAFGDSLSDQEIWALVVHIRELQAKALRAEFGSPKAVDGVYSSQKHKFSMEDVVTDGLDTPWSTDWLTDGKMLVTNRPGGMYVYEGGNKIAEVTGLPDSVEQGQGGLMDVRVHPTNGWVYLTLADPMKEGRGAMTKLYRGKIRVRGGRAVWSSTEVLFETSQDNYNRDGRHFGSKIVFDDNGHVFFSVGERGTEPKVQDVATPFGKIMRLNLDGSVPDDNPHKGNPMWTNGHRNQQGLTIDLEGNLWDTEHGPRGGDELNLITKGSNYGWPVRALSINYADTPRWTPWNEPGESFAMPAFRWLPSIGASGLDVVDGGAFPMWKGDLLAGGLVGNNLDRFTMKDGVMVEREELLHGIGRIRDISVHKDGTVYLTINGPDKVVRLVPTG